MDSSAYAEYQKIKSNNNNENSSLDALKYVVKWYSNSVKANSNMLSEYYKKSDDYIEQSVNNRVLDSTFSNINISDKNIFIENLISFRQNNPDFLTSIINQELSSKFWK